MQCKRCFGAFLLCLVHFVSGGGGGPTKKCSMDVMVKMRDNVLLYTQITVSSELCKPGWNETARPVVIDSSPYSGVAEPLASVGATLQSLGMVSIKQQIRGTGKSGGHFRFWRNASQDQADTIQWALKQPWCDGRIFGTGMSADGISEFLATGANPTPPYSGQFFLVSSAQLRHLTYWGGALRHSLADGWLKAMDKYDTPTINGTRVVPATSELVESWIRKNEAPGGTGWHESALTNADYSKVTWPSVHWTGWWDILNSAHLEAYEGYHTHSAGGTHQLFVGPVGHCALFDAPLHMYSNGMDGVFLAWMSAAKAWFNVTAIPPTGCTKPKARWEAALPTLRRINLYLMTKGFDESEFGNYWVSLDQWPSRTIVPWHLHPDPSGSSDGCRSPSAGCALALNAPANTSGHVEYSYDPQSPAPTTGGNLLLHQPCGPQEQSKIEERTDSVVFTSMPLSEPVTIVGRVKARLYVSSSAVDTDFIVSLSDVHKKDPLTPWAKPSSVLVRYGVTRMKWRNNTREAALLTPGDVYEIDVDMWATAYTFQPGHSIRLLVTSSNAPQFLPNPNTGQSFDGGSLVANNSLHFAPDRPSRVELPVVPLTSLPPNKVVMKIGCGLPPPLFAKH